jgi:SAM-dependent methyltransferase
MSFGESIIYGFIQKKTFTYYPEDVFLVRKVLSFISKEKPCVLDVGCGNGHYSFLFEKCGANVIGFDNAQFIEENCRNADLTGSSIKFFTADGNYPEKYFSTSLFDIIFMSGFSLFGTNISQPLMKKYLNLISPDGILVFIQNSNQRGDLRRTQWRNYSIRYLTNEFSELNCNIEKVFFYDRHITGRLLHSYAFSDISTSLHCIISRLTSLPCNILLIVSKEKNGG